MAEEEDKKTPTAAQLQIERLMRLKMEKEKKDSMKFDFRREEKNGENERESGKNEDEAREVSAAEASAREKKPANVIRIEKRVYNNIHKIVSSLNASGGAKISKAAFVNAVLKEFLALGLDYSFVKDGEALRKMFERMKQGN